MPKISLESLFYVGKMYVSFAAINVLRNLTKLCVWLREILEESVNFPVRFEDNVVGGLAGHFLNITPAFLYLVLC